MKCNSCNETIPDNWTITLKRVTKANGTEELQVYHMMCSPTDMKKPNWIKRVLNYLTMFNNSD